MGTVTASDMTIDTRPCKALAYVLSGREMEAQYYGGDEDEEFVIEDLLFFGGVYDSASVPDSLPDEPTPAKPKVDIRTYFPETWLWDLHFVGDSGSLTLSEELPHTVTEWVGTGFCSHTSSGLGVSTPTAIKGFQPFFLSLTLPFSVVRGEILNLPVTVFNYLSECLVVKLTLASSTDYDVIGSVDANWCVCGQESVTHYYKLKPKSLGEIDITIRAVSIDNNGVCGNEVFMSDQIGVRDALTRKLLVEGEGREDEYTITHFMCPSTTQTKVQEVMSLQLPSDYVNGTERAYISAIGDIMGPSLSGLDKLIRQPTGCGEQNMLLFTPNIYVLKYLKATNQLKAEIKNKALGHMRTGYQRELTYRHDDGSFSAFGKRDDSGSTWLTAFVVKSFAQAKEHIDIDNDDLEKSVKWFLNKQKENGCFMKVGRVIHKDMKGGLGGGSNEAALTTFVLIALLESRTHVNVPGVETAIQSGFNCLRSQSLTDTYTVSLAAYAHALRGGPMTPEKSRILRLLKRKAIKSGGQTHWSNSNEQEPQVEGDNDWTFTPHHKPKASDVEMTSYVLMSMIENEATQAIAKGLPVVKWLSAQRNAYGGFSSTQDTVLALQALASYATLAYTDGGQLTVSINTNNDRHTMMVNNDNKLVLQKMDVTLPNRRVTVEVTGTGCVLVQASVKYNVANISTEQPAFSLKSDLHRQDNCKIRKIKVCAKYKGTDGASNMAVITVKMVSGWIPDKDSVKRLLNEVGLGLKRYELEMNLVNFYFDELTGTETCLSFKVEQDVEVEHAKPGQITVYDYYNTELSVTQPYEIKKICGTKEELPIITQEEYDRKHEDLSIIEQVRVPLGEGPRGRPEVECDRGSADDRMCKENENSPVCSGHGSCVCGQCTCDSISQNNPIQKYTGRYCECNSYSCNYFNGMICGGPTNGVCSCGQCICTQEYSGNACQCTLKQDTCMSLSGKVCNGQGRCLCGTCQCEGLFRGPTCDDHPHLVPVEEPVIVPEHFQPLGSQNCPVCSDEKPANFLDQFCAANKAYKVQIRSRGRYPLKLNYDMRKPGRFVNINKVSSVEMPQNCTCNTISNTQNNGRKAVILTNTTHSINRNKKASLSVNSESVIFLLPASKRQSQSIINEMRNKLKRNGCP